MSEYLIFQVQCSVENIDSLKYHPIQCDILVLLQEESVIRTTAELNPCCFANTVLRLAHPQQMKQIILTSCSVVMENDDKTSFLLPLTPTPNDFWLEGGMIQSDIHLDFSTAVQKMEDRRVVHVLKQPLPDYIDNDFIDKKVLEVQGETSVRLPTSQHWLKTMLTIVNRSHQPIIEPGIAIPKFSVLHKNDMNRELSALEFYLQQEASKNDRLIGFLIIATILFLFIFGFVGYRIMPKTNHHASNTKTEELQKAWKATQHVRRQNRITYEKPFLLKPAVVANPKTIKVEPKIASHRPICISPPRPPKSPPSFRAQKSLIPRATMFEDELKAKTVKTSVVAVNKTSLSSSGPISWEDLM